MNSQLFKKALNSELYERESTEVKSLRHEAIVDLFATSKKRNADISDIESAKKFKSDIEDLAEDLWSPEQYNEF